MQRKISVAHGTLWYELVQTKRKNIEIRVLPDGRVRVFAPKAASLRRIDQFVLEQQLWIEEAQKRFAAYPLHSPEKHLASGAVLPLQGQRIELDIRNDSGRKQPVVLAGNKLILYASDSDGVEARRERITAWYRAYAGEVLRGRIEYFGGIVGRRPNRVSIREQKTRWGSCSSKGNINLNWKLILAPPECLDYVVIHELCHLHELNHSDKFWQRVGCHMPDYILWKRWLKENGAGLQI